MTRDRPWLVIFAKGFIVGSFPFWSAEGQIEPPYICAIILLLRRSLVFAEGSREDRSLTLVFVGSCVLMFGRS